MIKNPILEKYVNTASFLCHSNFQMLKKMILNSGNKMNERTFPAQKIDIDNKARFLYYFGFGSA